MNNITSATPISPSKTQYNNASSNRSGIFAISQLIRHIHQVCNSAIESFGSIFTAKKDMNLQKEPYQKLEQAIKTVSNSQEFITTKGIFRKSPNTSNDRILNTMLNNGQVLDDDFVRGNNVKPESLSRLLKNAFLQTVTNSPNQTAKLEKHLDIFREKTASIIDLIAIDHPDTSTTEAKEALNHAHKQTMGMLMTQIPPLEEQPLYLQKMMPLFFKIIDSSETNLMDANNLAICFAPNLRTNNLSPQKFIETAKSDVNYLALLIEREYQNYKNTLN